MLRAAARPGEEKPAFGATARSASGHPQGRRMRERRVSGRCNRSRSEPDGRSCRAAQGRNPETVTAGIQIGGPRAPRLRKLRTKGQQDTAVAAPVLVLHLGYDPRLPVWRAGNGHGSEMVDWATDPGGASGVCDDSPPSALRAAVMNSPLVANRTRSTWARPDGSRSTAQSMASG